MNQKPQYMKKIFLLSLFLSFIDRALAQTIMINNGRLEFQADNCPPEPFYGNRSELLTHELRHLHQPADTTFAIISFSDGEGCFERNREALFQKQFDGSWRFITAHRPARNSHGWKVLTSVSQGRRGTVKLIFTTIADY